MTGRFSPAFAAAVQTLRYRQSSLDPPSIAFLAMNSALHGPNAPLLVWKQPAANLSAARTPFQSAASCGSRHRRSPTGGAANGMPLNAVTLPAVIPLMRPVSMRAGWFRAQYAGIETAVRMKG